ncbi:MAG: serine dehydratase subunit alpha family protein, partial [Proteobacteria bacterium]|nr:serine dehydratase subunit alpha family protein [Pseudomonadota bacterium]
MDYTIKDILKMEVAPALGCTEPAAVALCSAAAASLLKKKDISKIEVWVDPNIYKNGVAVSIPGAGENTGIDVAAALGAFGGNPDLGLEVLETIDSDILTRTKEFIVEGKLRVNLVDDKKGIYVRAVVGSGKDKAEAVIRKIHDHIVSLKLNGKTIEKHKLLSRTAKEKQDVVALEKWLSERTLEDLVELLKDLDKEDLDFIKEGVDFNMKLAEYGLSYGPGLGVGSTLERLVREGLLKRDIMLAARILTSAASDARMSGVKLPAMSSGGSGNHGLTAILPIWAVKDYIVTNDDKEILRAIALSHVVTGYVKSHTGRLTAVCGCSIAAGAGAAAGITYLMGGHMRHIAEAIRNLVGDLAGVICDGAKAGCSLKLATAAGTAVQSALFALRGLGVKGSDGIVGPTTKQTMKNVGELSSHG